jgi:hypothetical protein
MTLKKKDRVKKADVEGMIRASLEKIPGIRCAFIYGPFAEREAPQERDIELMVIGGPDLEEMEEITSEVENKIERSVHVYSFTLREIKERIGLKDRFIRKALGASKIMLIGDLNDLPHR